MATVNDTLPPVGTVTRPCPRDNTELTALSDRHADRQISRWRRAGGEGERSVTALGDIPVSRDADHGRVVVVVRDIDRARPVACSTPCSRLPTTTVTVTEPSNSSTESSEVATVNDTLPPVGTVTVRLPVAAPNAPSALTVTLTGRSAAGAGLAVRVNEASPPSVTPGPAVMPTTGSGGSSLSATLTVPVP